MITIRKATPADLDRLQRISRQTFAETFAGRNTDADMAKYLTERLCAERLAAELAERDSAFYFAQRGGAVIGYLKLNRGAAQTEPQHAGALEIERIYVLREFHGLKVGQLLYDKAMEVARRYDAPYIWLGVWEENPRAIAFYRKNGFCESGRHIFHLGDDKQTDLLMKLPLKG